MKSGDNNSSSTGTPKKFYAVQNGHQPGVYTDWPSAQKQITGWSKPKHRSFSTRAEAEAFVKAGNSDGATVPNVSVDDAASSTAPTLGARDTDSPAPSKRAKPTKKETAASKAKALASTMEDVGTMELGWDPLPADAEDGFDRRIIMDPNTGKIRWKTEEELNAMKLMPKMGDKFAETLHVWTDGACRNNGKKGAVAGVGVYFGKDDPRYDMPSSSTP
jgi:ribonuclease HI